MPRNPNKRRCRYPGCRAWAKRGGDLCSAHAHSSTLRRHGEYILPLIRAVARSSQEPTPDSLVVIDDELRNLSAARGIFLSWICHLEEDESEGGGARIEPTRFLRAWNDSTTRVVQLLRARRALQAKDEGEFDALLARVYGAIEEILPDWVERSEGLSSPLSSARDGQE